MVRSCAWLESLQIGDRVLQQGGIFEEFGKPAIAVEAQYALHSTGSVVVINVLGHPGLANGAAAVLLKYQPLDRDGVEVVATAKMKLPSGAVKFLAVLPGDSVMTRLAVISVSRRLRPISNKVGSRFRDAASRAATLIRHRSSRDR
jgi:hypothetical protein